MIRDCDVVIDDVSTTDLKDGEFDIEIGDTFDVAIADLIHKILPLDSHFSKILSMGMFLYEESLTLSLIRPI